jgi:hypothetical protein
MVIRGISLERHQAKLTVAGGVGRTGQRRAISNVAAAHIIVDGDCS